MLGIPCWALSDAPAALAAVAAAGSVLWAIVLARREMTRPPMLIVVQPCGLVHVDAQAVTGFTTAWRGPLVSMAWRSQGRNVRRLAFPDALDRGARRELRLWSLQRREDAPAAAVAP